MSSLNRILEASWLHYAFQRVGLTLMRTLAPPLVHTHRVLMVESFV